MGDKLRALWMPSGITTSAMGDAACTQVATAAFADQRGLVFWGGKVCGFSPPPPVGYFMRRQAECTFLN